MVMRSFIVPRDVIARLGGDDLAHTVMADTLGFHPLNAPAGTIPPDAVRELGNGNIQAGKRVLRAFMSRIRKHTPDAKA